MSKNLAHPFHLVCDDGKGGGWEWWEWHFVLLIFSYFGLCKVPSREGLRSSAVYLGDFPR